jgi:hypothetical protein
MCTCRIILTKSTKPSQRPIHATKPVNALIHRDYFVQDSIKVLVFDDRTD